MTIYQRIKKIGMKTIEHYHTDLTTHDRALCASMTPGTTALWSARVCGTHFAWLNHAQDGEDRATLEGLRDRLNYFDAVASVFGNENGYNEWYLLECVGKKQHGTICKFNAEEARELFVKRIRDLENALDRRTIAECNRAA